MTPTEQDKELRAVLDEFVLYTDSSSESNEPTELKLFLEQCGFPDAIDRLYSELMQLITTDKKRVTLEARLDELDRQPEFSWTLKRIAELKAQQEEV